MEGKQARLEALLTNIQQRWGADTIHQGQRLNQQRPKISTRFKSVDVLLEGGIPSGQATELLGNPTSGMTTLAYKIIASAVSSSAFGIYIDLSSTFDPDYAVRCGIAQERLFLARPDTELLALDIARDLLSNGSVAIIALDLGEFQLDGSRLRRLTAVLVHSGCALLILQARHIGAEVSSPSSLRLLIERREWLRRQGDIRGYRVAVTVLKHPTSVGKQVEMVIDFDDNIAGEPI